MSQIRWRPSDDGFVESHDGRWRIVPCYVGGTRPQDYELYRDGKCLGRMYSTQREAKERAEDDEPRNEQCPGGGDWCLDASLWLDDKSHRYFCRGCGRYLKVPRSGHRVGLLPAHKREIGQGFRPHPSEIA